LAIANISEAKQETIEKENTETTQVKTETERDIGLKVLGTIDLSKFEKPKKEIKKDKENIYIIDTMRKVKEANKFLRKFATQIDEFLMEHYVIIDNYKQ
jgi:hypothetical protein